MSLSSKWEARLLRDICKNVQYGHTASANDNPIGPKFLRITDIAQDHINWDSVPYCEIDHRKKGKYLLKKGDIVIARTGATTGYAKYIKANIYSIFASYLVRIQIIDDFDSRYVGYIVESEQYKRFIQANWGGAAQPNANAQTLTSYHLPAPPLPTQRKIASILSAYDDLIENNQRRIKILEEMAQNLYREWFVKFRFPGHEKVKFVDSPLGRIPEGWEVKGLGDVATNFDRLRKPLSKMVRAKRQGKYPYYGAAKIFDYIDDFIFDGVYLLMAEDGSVITPDRKPVLQYVTGKFWANNHTHILQGIGAISTEFLYLFLSDLDVTGYITGAAQPKITQANLNRIPIIVSDDFTLFQFNKIIEIFFRQKILLGEKIHVLRRTRDLLLPKLISGEIDVSDLDIAVPEEVGS